MLQSEAGLVEEIDYDLRRFQKEEQERKEKAKVKHGHAYGRRGGCGYDQGGGWGGHRYR